MERNFRAFERMQLHMLPVDFQGDRPDKNKEELIGLAIEISDLAASRRHALLQHSQAIGQVDQIPPITYVSPGEVFGYLSTDHGCSSSLLVTLQSWKVKWLSAC